MGRLTEAFGFMNVSPKKLNRKWVQHHMTKLNVASPDVLELRSDNLSYLRTKLFDIDDRIYHDHEKMNKGKKFSPIPEDLLEPKEPVQHTFFNDVI